ncbi:MAG: DUF460 domain-containing protein [Candidatus Nanohalobium sp.]
MKPLIVGIDPGSTSAVAAVDLNGEIQLLESGKNFPPRKIIQRTVKVGKPVVVTSDKGKTPSKVEKIANSVGARLYEPETDLSTERKKELGKGANSHELDAVASAVNAHRQLQRDIQKIRKYDDRMEKPLEEIARKIFKDRPLEENDEEDTEHEQTVPNGEKTEKPGKNDGKQRIQRMQRKIENLEKQVEDLKTEKEDKEDRVRKLENRLEKIKEEERKEVVENREIKKREAIIRDKEAEIEELRRELEKAAIRERQYREALENIRLNNFSVVPVLEEEEERPPEKAVARDRTLIEKLQKQGVEIHHVEEVEGVELRDYMVVEELPDSTDFESVIEEYQNDR